MKRSKFAIRLMTAIAMLCGVESSCVHAQESMSFRTHQTGATNAQSVFLPYAQFQIPFNVDTSGSQPSTVQLLVSTDAGKTWQQQGRANPDSRHFDFRAAAEGEYLFTVQTLDASGVAFPSPNPPMRVHVDTTKPQVAVRADLDHSGHLIVDLRAADDHIDLKSAVLKIRSDRDSQWREVPVAELTAAGGYYEGQIEVLVPQCREIAIVFSINDQAKNNGSTSYLFTMPRTAAQPNDLQLASTQTRPGNNSDNSPYASGASSPQNAAGFSSQPIAGATPWDLRSSPQGNGPAGGLSQVVQQTSRPNNPGFANNSIKSDAQTQNLRQGNFPTTPRGANLNVVNQQFSGEQATVQVIDSRANQQIISGPGQLARTAKDLELGPSVSTGPEELTIPPAYQQSRGSARSSDQTLPAQNEADLDGTGFSKPYYCKSRTFSLDYSVEALGGNALSEVELWGTEDNGRTWEKWGADPDRVSPFDVKVGNDGMFGFRMVLVGTSGSVLGSPKAGDDADAWIRVDTELPECKITRAVYGVGSEAGMLVIDYTCNDADLTEEGISLLWSPMPDGPWTPIASAFKNTGLYLWKADPGLPNRVYLKLEAVDKAGNKGVHRMDLPIDTKGLAPRGRIQGIRPITN